MFLYPGVLDHVHPIHGPSGQTLWFQGTCSVFNVTFRDCVKVPSKKYSGRNKVSISLKQSYYCLNFFQSFWSAISLIFSYILNEKDFTDESVKLHGVWASLHVLYFYQWHLLLNCTSWQQFHLQFLAVFPARIQRVSAGGCWYTLPHCIISIPKENTTTEKW